MKKCRFFLCFSLILATFSGISQENRSGGEEHYISVGEPVDSSNLLSAHQMQEHYSKLQPGDTLHVSFKADVASVCKNKGCWMKIALKDGREVMVKFKNYAFFVPKDVEQKEVIMEGKAYVSVMSVKDQRHYAEDAGMSAAEVNAITNPEITLSFLAHGVKIKN